MLHSYKILFPTLMGTFTMTFPKFWTLPTIKILPPLAPLLPTWIHIVFPNYKFNQLDRVNPVTVRSILLAVDLPL